MDASHGSARERAGSRFASTKRWCFDPRLCLSTGIGHITRLALSSSRRRRSRLWLSQKSRGATRRWRNPGETARSSCRQTIPCWHPVCTGSRGSPERDGGGCPTHAERMASRDGYFAPDSVIRRVGNSPPVPLLGGGPAVLLQVAHPLVAAGVVDHSDYRRDLWPRRCERCAPCTCSPGWTTSPPSAWTRASASPTSATAKYGSEKRSPGPGPRSCSPSATPPSRVCRPRPSPSSRSANGTPSSPSQNRRARSGSSAGNSTSESSTMRRS
jgi:hypothetical protein